MTTTAFTNPPQDKLVEISADYLRYKDKTGVLRQISSAEIRPSGDMFLVIVGLIFTAITGAIALALALMAGGYGFVTLFFCISTAGMIYRVIEAYKNTQCSEIWIGYNGRMASILKSDNIEEVRRSKRMIEDGRCQRTASSSASLTR